MILRSRPQPFYDPDPPAGGDPPPAVEAAEDQVEAAEAALDRAEATGDPKAIATAEARLKAAEDRLSKLETDWAEMRQSVEGKAEAGHTHELPGELKALHESLRQVEDEETPPAGNVSWLYRKIGRRRGA